MLDISLEELLNAGQLQPGKAPARSRIGCIVDTVLLGIGLACLALYLFRQREKD